MGDNLILKFTMRGDICDAVVRRGGEKTFTLFQDFTTQVLVEQSSLNFKMQKPMHVGDCVHFC